MDRREFVQAAASVPLVALPLANAPIIRPRSAVRKLFVYGGDFNSTFTKFAASLTGKANPRVCFLPTATGDAPGYVMRWFETCGALSVKPFVQRSFISSYGQRDSFETIFTGMDVIIVGGGNTLNMMAIWKAQGMDAALRKAYDQGVVLGGGSAGSLCWFEHGTSDSRPGALSRVDGLGFINGSHCPHYHAEPERRPLYWSKIRSGEYNAGYACDDGAGIYFENEAVTQVVALDDKNNAYYVSKAGGDVTEQLLGATILGA